MDPLYRVVSGQVYPGTLTHLKLQLPHEICLGSSKYTVADRVFEPGKPYWRKSDPPLRNHTRAAETEATYTLSVWPDPPNDEDATDQGQIFKCIQKEWTAQVRNIRETAAAEAAKADKDDDGRVDKGGIKKAKPKPK